MKRKKLTGLIFLVFSLFVLIQCYSVNVFSQNVTDDDVEESERKKKIAENEKAIAEAKKAKFDALFPKPDVSSLVGGTTINEGAFIETQILGYCAMKSAAKEVGKRINNLNDKDNLVVYSEADVKMVSRYKLIMNRLENLKRGYDAQYTPLLAAIQNVDANFQVPNITTIQSELKDESKKNVAAGLIIDTALKFLSLLKTDIEITPSEITIGEKEFVAEVFSNLDSNFKPYYPQTIPLSIQDCTAATLEACSPFLNQIMLTSEAHDKVAYLRLKAKKILDDIEANEKSSENIRKLNQEIAALDLIINNPATKKKEKEAKRKEREAKLADISGLTIGIAARNTKYTNPAGLSAFKNGYSVFASKISILNNIFKLTMDELGFKEELKKETPTQAQISASSPASTPCTGKDCLPPSSQTTNVNVNVGDKQDKKEESGGGGSDKTFASYLQAESLNNVISKTNSRWLEVKIIKAGGNMRVKSNIFTNLAVGSRVNFSGGAIVYFNVFDNQGKSEKSGVISAYNSYQKSSNIIGTCDQGETTQQRRRRRL